MTNYRANRMGRMGSIDASSTAGTSGGPSPVTGNSSSTNWADVGAGIASVANTGKGIVQGVLQAEATQNAINAQRNLTSALTPQVITIGLALIAYFILTRK